MMRVIRNAVLAAMLVLPGCADPELPEPASRLLNANGGFVLSVTNQSFAIDPVDIRVEIDGELVVSDYFHVGDQHRYVSSRLSLPPGKHRIRIWSANGGAELSTEFELKDHDGGVVAYCDDPKPHDTQAPRKFDFRTHKGPLMID